VLQLCWIPATAVSGLGFGLFVPPVIDIALVNVDPARAGSASGTLATVQQVGGALGVAVLGIIFFGLVAHIAPTATATASTTLGSTRLRSGSGRRRGGADVCQRASICIRACSNCAASTDTRATDGRRSGPKGARQAARALDLC